jgi:hypothetical protein
MSILSICCYSPLRGCTRPFSEAGAGDKIRLWRLFGPARETHGSASSTTQNKWMSVLRQSAGVTSHAMMKATPTMESTEQHVLPGYRLSYIKNYQRRCRPRCCDTSKKAGLVPQILLPDVEATTTYAVVGICAIFGYLGLHNGRGI